VPSVAKGCGSRIVCACAMLDSQPLPDDNDRERVYEELLCRSKERADVAVMLELAEKYFLPPPESIVGLAYRLMARQAVESTNPKLWRNDIPGYLLPIYWDGAAKLSARIIRAHDENDYKFQRRLYEAEKLVKKGDPISWSIGVTGYALMAWLRLDDEFGHCPSRDQLRERTEQLRKEDGLDPKFSQRQWEQALYDLKPLIP
jgi:hypothetical protein